MDKKEKNYFHEFNADEYQRYKRHLTLNEIGIKGQKKLKDSSVLFVGAGGLGSSAILYSAAAGIGTIGIVDNDKVDKSNLQRQVIHNTNDIDKNKTDSSRQKINLLNPNCKVITYTERINSKNILRISQQFDIVCDCSDNFGTRYLINDACVILNKPLIFASVQGFEGQISVFNLTKDSPNLRDLIPNSPNKNKIPSCNEFGVVGVSTGLIGVLQANEIIKIIIGKGEILDGKLLIFNLLNTSMKKLTLHADPKNIKTNDLTTFSHYYENSVCLDDKHHSKQISNNEFKNIYRNESNKIIIIDVRETDEFKKSSLKGSISIPLSILNNQSSLELIKKYTSKKTIYTLCQKGIRSQKASEILFQKNIESISIEGGLDSIELLE